MIRYIIYNIMYDSLTHKWVNTNAVSFNAEKGARDMMGQSLRPIRLRKLS